MNCSEMNIWFDQANKEELLAPNGSRLEHLDECSSCSKSHKIILEALETIDEQRRSSLSDELSNNLVNLLTKGENHVLTLNPLFRISKTAAVAVLVIGIAAGVLAGSLISMENSVQDDDTWKTEFSMLSENDDFVPSIFD